MKNVLDALAYTGGLIFMLALLCCGIIFLALVVLSGKTEKIRKQLDADFEKYGDFQDEL